MISHPSQGILGIRAGKASPLRPGRAATPLAAGATGRWQPAAKPGIVAIIATVAGRFRAVAARLHYAKAPQP